MNLPETIKRKLQELPDKPGCYLMRDRYGRIIYVGKAAVLRDRVRHYFRQAARRSAGPKLRGLIKSIADFDIIVVKNEAAAILTEGQLIKKYRPRYNTLFKDDKRFPLLRIDLRQPYPRFRLGRIQRNDGAAYFGPYASSAAARAALEFVEKHFGIRKCAPLIPGPAEHRHCINDIVRFCAAPCIGKTTGEEYCRRAAEACAFLRGERPEILKAIEAEMKSASGQMQFEKAAALRDTLTLLRMAVQLRARGADATGVKPEDAQAGLEALRVVLGLDRRPRLIEAFDISCISGTHAVGGLVAAVDGLPRPARYRRFRIKTIQSADDPAMLAEVIRRRFQRLQREGGAMPDLILVDGGITQLRAAQAELGRLNLAHLAVAGLAKRFEELYHVTNGASEMLVLPADSPALHVLQRLRDEAHRFALAYHLNLRGRRIRESVLDDVPGIGPERKARLLRRFGSVARMARATESEIAAVPGIGRQVAGDIKKLINRGQPRA